jgi:multidrug efflux system outer membrane protein
VSARAHVRIAIALAALAGGVAAGCAIGPNYKRPPVTEVSAFRGQSAAEAASLADAPWWDLFQDPIL